MKIDPTRVIIDHIRTLRNDNSGKISFVDIFLFFILPLATGALAFIFLNLRAEIYNAGLAFYGIFIGLLINVQVAMFSIFQRKWAVLKDKRSDEARTEVLAQRNIILKESNANISYLILISCVAAFVSLILYVFQVECGWGPAISVLITSHFFLTLLMVVKRLHALFAKEYDEDAA